VPTELVLITQKKKIIIIVIIMAELVAVVTEADTAADVEADAAAAEADPDVDVDAVVVVMASEMPLATTAAVSIATTVENLVIMRAIAGTPLIKIMIREMKMNIIIRENVLKCTIHQMKNMMMTVMLHVLWGV
jgi:hypothetical protein